MPMMPPVGSPMARCRWNPPRVSTLLGPAGIARTPDESGRPERQVRGLLDVAAPLGGRLLAIVVFFRL